MKLSLLIMLSNFFLPKTELPLQKQDANVEEKKREKGKKRLVFFSEEILEKTDDKIVLVNLIKAVIQNGNRIHMKNGK